MLEKTLRQGIDQWSETSLADLKKLAQDFELELHDHAFKVDLSAIGNALGCDAGEPPSARPEMDGVRKLRNRVFGFGPVLRESFDAYVHSNIGMSLKTASDKLRKLKDLEGDELAEAIKKLFTTAGRMEEASKYVKWSEAASVLGPIVGQLADLAFEVTAEHLSAQEAAERKRRRDGLHQRLADLSAQVVEQANTALKAVCDELDARLAEHMDGAGEGKAQLVTGCIEIDRFLEGLSSLLDQMADPHEVSGTC